MRPAMVSSAPSPPPETSQAWLVYDGDCPFCSRYVRYLRLREVLPSLRLVDARGRGPEVGEAATAGFDLDEGMVLRLDGQWYFGADCVHALALLSTGSGWFNRLNAVVFRSATLSRWLYPLLRACRNATLVLLGRRKLNDRTAL